jgi:hypothetical protein
MVHGKRKQSLRLRWVGRNDGFMVGVGWIGRADMDIGAYDDIRQLGAGWRLGKRRTLSFVRPPKTKNHVGANCQQHSKRDNSARPLL